MDIIQSGVLESLAPVKKWVVPNKYKTVKDVTIATACLHCLG